MQGEVVNLNITLMTIGMTLLNTVILFWIMKKLLFKPVHDFMESRNERISSEIKKAEGLNIEAVSKFEEYNKKLIQIKEERNSMVEEGRIKGEALFEKIKQEAEEERIRLIQNAEKEKIRMMKNAREELRKEVAELSLRIAEEVLKKEINEKEHRDFIDEAIEDISKINS